MDEIAWDRLCSYLSSLQPGSVEDTSQLEDLLVECWGEIGGANQESMAAYKLRGRMEDVEWDPPDLLFTIARHGGTVHSSSREELHRLAVDVQTKRVVCNPRYSHRQVKPMATPVRIKPIAKELVDIIQARRDDDRLKWSGDHQHVKVNLTQAVGGADGVPKQTLQGRCRRLRDELIRILPEHGWHQVGNTGAAFEFKG